MKEENVEYYCDLCGTELEPNDIKSIDGKDFCEECYYDYPEWFRDMNSDPSRSKARRLDAVTGFPTPPEVRNHVWVVFGGEIDAPMGSAESVEEAKEWIEDTYEEISVDEYLIDIFDGEEALNARIETDVNVVIEDG